MTPVPRIVVAGGGPAAIEAALALRELAGDIVELELIAPDRDLVVRPYEVLAPFHEGRERHYPLAAIAQDLGATLVHDGVTRVDAESRSVTLRSGARRAYDRLIVAVGARQRDAVRGALPFRGAKDAARVRALLLESHAGLHRSVAFIVPGGRTWPLPMYELALHTSGWLAERGVGAVPLLLVTPEPMPLAAFGTRASDEVAQMLRVGRVQFVSGHAVRHENERLLLAGGRAVSADLAIALSRLEGPSVEGLPRDDEGFVPIDDDGRVVGVDGVFAAGDATTYPVKQGGLATQQADAIARIVALEAGARVSADRLQPVLRSVLFAGNERRYLFAELGDRLEESSQASETPLWSEPSKLVGRHLAPYLERLKVSADRAEGSA